MRVVSDAVSAERGETRRSESSSSSGLAVQTASRQASATTSRRSPNTSPNTTDSSVRFIWPSTPQSPSLANTVSPPRLTSTLTSTVAANIGSAAPRAAPSSCLPTPAA